jgi:uncharacterized protein (TIGR02757 family)
MNPSLRSFLDEKAELYNRPEFIAHDPIVIPHGFSRLQDIEISGLFAATLAWGQRGTIIKKCRELLAYMDHAPYDFVLHHSEGDLRPLAHFVHRTFNGTDTLYFIAFLHSYYQKHSSLEDLFARAIGPHDLTLEAGLIAFHQAFFSLDFAPNRTRKHVATPVRKSACKRLNMYLRWMVRQDDKGVDFGLWRQIRPSQLVCPCDLHVDRVARKLGLITRKSTDWLTALELTENLRQLDSQDPVRYDFALFGLGIEEKF